MRRQVKFFPVIRSGAIVGCLLCGLSTQPVARAQQAGAATGDGSAKSLRDLEGQISDLNTALRELRLEVARSRQESLELRKELAETRRELVSLNSGPGREENPSSGATSQGPPAAGGPTPAAQVPEGTSEHKLARVQEDLQLLEGKVDEQHQTKVESASKFRVKLSGIALLNVFGNRGAVDNLDVPSLARDRGALNYSQSFGATVRQTMIGLELFGPTWGNAKTGAEVQFDFFGGFPATPEGVTTGIVRMRTAKVYMHWSRTSIVAGQDAPFFSPLSPTSLASLAVPALSYAGNLWVWTPQVRVEHRLPISDTSGFLVQAGILDPLSGEPPYSGFYRYPQAGESSGQPAYATRLAWDHVGWGGPLTLGMGGYYSRQNWGFQREVDAWAGTADWNVPLSQWFSLSGEFYRGRGLGGLGGGTGRSVLYNGPLTMPGTSVLGLNTTGGWSQFKFRPTPKLEFNTAFGEDFPSPRDLSHFSMTYSYNYATVARNQSGFFNVIYHARSNLLLAGEYRRLWTYDTYQTQDTAGQINLSVGVLF